MSKCRLLLNRLRFTIGITHTKHFFLIILFEKYKPVVRIIRFTLTLIGLFSAFLVFQSIIYAFLFGLLIYGLSTLFERTVFSYRTMYVHILPDFKIQNDKWVGCLFGYGETPDHRIAVPIIGMALSEEDYARSIHRLLMQWTMGEPNDLNKNVTVKVVVTNPTEYIFYVYPNILKTSATVFYGEVDEERKKDSLTDIQHRFAVMFVLGKSCQIFEGSSFARFREVYQAGCPVHFQIQVQSEDGRTSPIPDLEDIIIHDFSIQNIDELTRKDLEYDLHKRRTF